jgi:hypothetical protein
MIAMPDIKLAKLPDRTPVKISISVLPALNGALEAYAAFYNEAYGQSETVAELIPYMLQNFLDGDRGFAKALKAGEVADSPASASPVTGRRRRRNLDSDSETSS